MRATLRRWQMETAFAGVRNPEQLNAVPEAERPPWRALWREIAETLKGLEEADRS
jgi:hypothetical protein